MLETNNNKEGITMNKQQANKKVFTFEEMTAFVDANDSEIDKMRKENPSLYGDYLAQLINGADGVNS